MTKKRALVTGGSGEIGADSAVHLTFRSIMGDSQTQLPAMKSMLGGASGNFLLIHVDGTLADPDTRKRLTDSGAVIDGGSQEAFAAKIAREQALRRDIVRKQKLTLD